MKFILELSPVRPVSLEEMPAPILDKEGSSLWINGEELDFSFIEDGDVFSHKGVEGPNAKYFFKPLHREGDTLFIPLILPHDSNASDAVAFPAPITVDEDGSIVLPSDEPTVEEDPFEIVINEGE